MKQKICFLAIDTEEDFINSQTVNSFEGVKNLKLISPILKEFKLRPTFFCTGKVLENFASLFKQYQNFGCEIALHGFYDHLNMKEQNQKEREEKLSKHYNLYQNIFKEAPVGFRAVQNTIDEAGLKLLENKFKYDSSIISFYPHFKKYIGYTGKTASKLYRPDNLNILEIPLNPLFAGVQLQGKWLRELGVVFYKFWLKIKQPELISLSFHSWDLNPEQKNGGEIFVGYLRKIILLLKEQGYEFKNGQEIYGEYK
ncbi:MAG: hypothetical protein US42_C0004G0026 [Candidatus Magasanikbacteria bacterium GW2011_GWC2_37_14]|uniref:NodB homology domain-containing protein n=1 Tax=Candidatus Magasanikbacteria bacterium GW2011_GWC2_37_14 TaxID=1619046 RepID=A0A0G0GD24_9BACT|nr:MAG: hypothetical protein US42_C0004G0026 [Candidatus Magasanikbacteria bacterium GW2011_GWC2_37_14]